MTATVEEVETTLSSNVALNDISSPTPSTLVNALMALRRLEEQRLAWETGSFLTSNKEKYAILGDCLVFCGELAISEAKKRSAALEKFHKERGYTYKHESPLATRVVRAVFGDINRRRVSTYSLVLRQAQKAKILPTDLASWIEAQGGVEEVRLSKSESFISPAEKVEMAKDYFECGIDLVIAKSEDLSFYADAEYIGTTCVLLAEQQADGGFAVRAVIRKDAAVKAALLSLYSQLKDDAGKQQANAKAANDADGQLAA